jgi:lipopolysaccharide transport system ATP-binding protein
MKPIVRVENLSKAYRLAASRAAGLAPRESLARAFGSPFALFRRRPASETFWALRDVSFEVFPGEVIGIIGRNGAGKSTLLKILSRIVEPTSGRAELYGRVSSLLEVGTGFHPELTGRENIFLNGSILGLSRREVSGRFDEIVAFAEVERFVDTPVKHYSSGMYTRLAFAVAAHLDPEILIVDEVLSVGDAQFQQKCMGVMDGAARAGRTVLFVSHNMAAVSNLCRRGLLLDGGRVVYIGSQTEAVARYLKNPHATATSLRERTDREGNGQARVYALEIRNTRGELLDVVASGQDVDLFLHYESAAGFDASGITAGICVKTQMDVPIFLQHNRLTGQGWADAPRRGAFVCRIPRLPLPPSIYRVTFSLMRGGQYLDAMDNACELNVTGGDFFGSGEVPPATHGCCLVDAHWRLEVSDSRVGSCERETADCAPEAAAERRV